MRLTVKIVGFGLGLATVVCLTFAGSVLAANKLCPDNAPPEIKNSEVCQNQNDPVAGPGGLISDITSIVAIVAGLIAVVMIMYGGYKFITSTGDSGKVQEAKKTITWSVIGLVVIVLARSIIIFVLEKV